MYAPFFGLRQEAFSIAPDPRFLYMSAMHREALAHLTYGLGAGGGFVLLTGEIGAGKTTVCRCFLEQVPASHHVAYIYNPRLTVRELLRTIGQEFGAPMPPGPSNAASLKDLVDALNAFMLDSHAAGRNCLLVIDEAQGLSPAVLEQLRLLTNLETRERKLLQIILIGQPELRRMLARPELEQVSQRIVARVHLGPLNAAETADYVRHRLAVAGHGRDGPFDAAALRRVHALSGGVPRRINLLCDRAMLGAFAGGRARIDRAIVDRAAREVFDGVGPEGRSPGLRRGLSWGAATLGVAALLVAAGAWQLAGDRSAGAPAAAAAAASAASAAARAAHGAASGGGASTVAFATPEAALGALALRWPDAGTGTPPAGSDTDCAALRRRALACHEGHGGLETLRRLDRPALLRLDDGEHWLLVAAGPRQATLQGAEGERTLDADALAQHWNGRFLTLWKLPPGWVGDDADLAAGPAAEWLSQRLAALQGPTQAAASPGRQDLLRQRVFAFQVQQGLPLDGLAGPQTLMALNRAVGIDEPRLRQEP